VRADSTEDEGRKVDVFYGDTQAMFDVDVDIKDEPGHGLHRPVGLRQVDLPALPEPDERHHRYLPRGRQDHHRWRGHLRPVASTRCSCAPRSAWCSRSRTRSRSRSTTTSPTARASTAWPPTRPTSKRSWRSLQKAGLLGRGQGPPGRARHRPVRRPAAAPVHRRAIAVLPEVILMDEPCSALDPIATAKVEELIDELRENYSIVIVTHSMQQAARVSQRTAFFHLGELGRGGPPKTSSPIRGQAHPGLHHRPLRLTRARDRIETHQGEDNPMTNTYVTAFDDDLKRSQAPDREMGGLAEDHASNSVDRTGPATWGWRPEGDLTTMLGSMKRPRREAILFASSPSASRWAATCARSSRPSASPPTWSGSATSPRTSPSARRH
jgi:hypothetical protein